MRKVNESEAILILKSEGLYDAFIEVASLLASPDGIEKHGPRYWQTLSLVEHHQKGLGHALKGLEIDPDSGRPHAAHAVARQLMVLAIEQEAFASEEDQ